MKKKTGRRMISLLMALILAIGTLQVPGLTLKVYADTVESGVCGNGVEYVLDSDGVLTISKTGAGDGAITAAPWDAAHYDEVKEVVIESGVTGMRVQTFGDYPELTKVSIAGSVQKIPMLCFQDCVKLSELNLSEGLEIIAGDAFFGCSMLENVTLPKSVKTIDGAFWNCPALKAVNVTEGSQALYSVNGVVYNSENTCLVLYPCAKAGSSFEIRDTVTEIRNGAFYGCNALESITIPDGVRTIGNGAFRGSGLKSVTIPANIESLGASAFAECTGLTDISVPGGVGTISQRSFADCSSLTSAVIGEGVKVIDQGAFAACTSLKEITLPKSITEIYSEAFDDCSDLVITYAGTSDDWNKVYIDDSVGWNSFSVNCIGTATAAEGECGDNLTWRLDNNGLLTISGTGAVTDDPWNDEHRLDVRKAFIGKDVTDIKKANFLNSSNLEDISVEAGNTEYLSEEGVLFNKNKTEIIQYPSNKDGAEYTVPESVTVIGYYAFVLCSKLTGISLPDGVTTIDEGAFSKCIALKNIDIPENVTEIKAAAFFGCKALEDITVPDGVTAIRDKTFANCSALKSITFSDSVTSIEQNAFGNCSSLTDVYYGGGETNWDSITVGANNDALNKNKLHYMKGSCGTSAAWTLTKDGVLTISGTGVTDRVAGEEWKSADVKEVRIGNGITKIGAGLFSFHKITSITIPEGVTYIGDGAFYGCRELKEAAILNDSGDTVVIGSMAFFLCDSLESLTMPCIVVIRDEAFACDVKLKDVYYGGTEENWKYLTIGNENDYLKQATIHYTVFVTGVSIAPATLELRVGESGTLTETVAPAEASNKKVSWTSSKPEIATVADGVVTAAAEGETDITVTTEDGGKTATCKVTVAGYAVTGVTIAPESLNLRIGESGTLTATVAPAGATNKKVSWTSSKPEIATVADGVVTAVAEGETIITVTTEDGDKTATCKVTVAGFPVTGVNIAPETLSLEIGKSGTLTVTVSPKNATNKKVSWTSSKPEVATVADGVVTAVAEGEAVITVTTEDGNKTANCKVTVVKPADPVMVEGPLGPDTPDLSRYTASGNEIAVKSINLKKTVFKDVKGIKKFNVTAGDATAVKIKGSTLTVLKDATVTIEAVNKKKEKIAEKTITVIVPQIDTKPATEINRRGNLDLNKYILSTVQPSAWKSSNKKVATVSENGLLLMKKSGTVKISVSFPAEKGMSAKKLTIKLKIKMPQFKKTTYTVKAGKTVKTAVKNAESSEITYRIEDPSIATVDASGKVTGVSKGTTKLIMRVRDIDYETTIKVK